MKGFAWLLHFQRVRIWKKEWLSQSSLECKYFHYHFRIGINRSSYFSAYALNYFYFPSPIHSKYINKEVLARYFPVGGVRIEDDLLITSKGYENLTTAPKGEAML